MHSGQNYAFKALKIFETIKDTSGIAATHMCLFDIASNIDDTAVAEKALNKMLKFAKAAKDTSSICQAYSICAMIAANADAKFEKCY